jgi:hypothetical protein
MFVKICEFYTFNFFILVTRGSRRAHQGISYNNDGERIFIFVKVLIDKTKIKRKLRLNNDLLATTINFVVSKSWRVNYITSFILRKELVRKEKHFLLTSFYLGKYNVVLLSISLCYYTFLRCILLYI